VVISPDIAIKRINREVIRELSRVYHSSHLGNRLLAFDGVKNVYNGRATTVRGAGVSGVSARRPSSPGGRGSSVASAARPVVQGGAAAGGERERVAADGVPGGAADGGAAGGAAGHRHRAAGAAHAH
ncbi:unnamed protein product, partial [Closterium sp. Naga37s-1]